MLPGPMQILLLIIIFVLTVLPVLLVIKSRRSSGGEKWVWIVVTVIFSWIGFLAFILFTKKAEQENQGDLPDE